MVLSRCFKRPEPWFGWQEGGGDQRASSCTSAALQVSGEAAFPLLDLRVDFRAGAVEELMELYERSQDRWAQQWRDELLELPMLNRLVA